MRIIISFFYSLLFLSIVLQSCSVEKRHYTSGYHLQWKNNKQPVQTTSSNKNLTTSQADSNKVTARVLANEINYPGVNLLPLTASSQKGKGVLLFLPDSTKCDTLIMRNETEIKVKITEITPTEIKYKYCDNLNGPTYVSYRYEVSYIKYANGRFDSFANEFPPAAVKTPKNKQQGDSEDSWVERYVSKRSTSSMIFSFFALIPFYGAPASVIAVILGLKCLKLINKNPKELLPYKQRTMIGLILGGIIFLIYFILFAYVFLKTTGLLRLI